MLALIIAACGAGSRRCHSITWLCAEPPQPPTTRSSSAIPGAPLPPSKQPNVSRMSLQVAMRVAAGRSASPHPHTCSANAQAGSLVGVTSVILFCRFAASSERIRCQPRGQGLPRRRLRPGRAAGPCLQYSRLYCRRRHCPAILRRRRSRAGRAMGAPHVYRLGGGGASCPGAPPAQSNSIAFPPDPYLLDFKGRRRL